MSGTGGSGAARAAEIVLERHADGIDLTIKRPRRVTAGLYELGMWMPLVALIAFIAWLFLSRAQPLPRRTSLIALIGLVPAGILYCITALTARPGWARAQRIRIRDGLLHKQYPFGQIDSLALPVQLDLTRYKRCEAVLEHVKKDEQRVGFRPPMRNRVRIECDHKPVLWLGPSLTLWEGQLVADHLNEYFESMDTPS
jgi:hypothetical protein